VTEVGAQADGGMQPGSKERWLWCPEHAQRSAVARGGYASSAPRSIHGLLTLYVKWQLYCIKKGPSPLNLKLKDV